MQKHYLPGHTWPRLSLFVFFILACLTRLHAQTIYPAVNPDQFLSNDVSPTLQNVNCDMLRNHHVRSIVWEGTSGTNVYISNDAAETTQFTIPDAHWADVAFFDYYTVAVIYVNNSGKVFLNIYGITGWGSGPITATLSQSTLVTSASSPDLAPHIDAIPEIGPGPTSIFNKFVISYLEQDMVNGTVNLYTAFGDIAGMSLNAPLLVSTQALNPNAFNADVSGYYDYPNGIYYACLGIQNVDNNTLDFAQADLGNNILVAYNTLFSGIGNIDYTRPRIESQFSVDNQNYWTIASSIVEPSSGLNTWIFNPTMGSANTMAAYPFLWHNWAPAIASGPCLNNYSSFCDLYYAVGWFTAEQSSYVTKAANAFPGPVISPAYPFYYQVNSGAVNYPAVISAPLAMSSTSDYGSDLLTAWYDNNGSILYKLNADITAYRQANTGISGATAGTCTVYPNPAAGYLYVSDFATAESYDITTITGQHVLSGTFKDPVNTRIDISGIANGTYMITIRNKAGMSSPVKFVKE